MPRKANGESSIYQDANGTWHGKVSMGLKANGERDRRHVTGRRRADVLRKNRVLEQQREAGMAAAAGRSPTVGFWLDHWLNTIAVRRVRPSTFTRYEQLVRLHLIPGLGHHRLDRLQPEHVEALYGRMHDSGRRRPACCRRTGCCPGRSRSPCSAAGWPATWRPWSMRPARSASALCP